MTLTRTAPARPRSRRRPHVRAAKYVLRTWHQALRSGKSSSPTTSWQALTSDAAPRKREAGHSSVRGLGRARALSPSGRDMIEIRADGGDRARRTLRRRPWLPGRRSLGRQITANVLDITSPRHPVLVVANRSSSPSGRRGAAGRTITAITRARATRKGLRARFHRRRRPPAGTGTPRPSAMSNT